MQNKSIIGIIVAIVAIALVALFIGKGGKKEVEQPETIGQVSYYVKDGNTIMLPAEKQISMDKLADGVYEMTEGTSYWYAEKTGGEHQGTVKATKGTFEVKAGKIVSGTVSMDMNTLVNTDGGKADDKLVGHLKSADFFDVATSPTAALTLSDWSDQSMAKSDVEIRGKKVAVAHKVELTKEEGGEKVTLAAPLFLITDDFGIGQTAMLKPMLKSEFTVGFVGTFELKK